MMPMPKALRAILSLFLPVLLFHHHSANAVQVPLAPQSQLRNATLDDVEAIVDIFTAAFAPMPDWQYLFPFRDAYPRDHKRCYRRTIMLMLTNPNAHTQVIEGPPGSQRAVIAAAVWVQQVSLTRLDTLGRSDECLHKDMNITRALDYELKFNAAKRKYVDDVFGADQLYLHQLATHPDYQARGAGTQLIESGLERGKKTGVNVSLIAQPTAEGFYLHRGFKEMRNISIESVDGERAFGYNVMARKFDSESSDMKLLD